jgi:hypothetical protein
MEWLGRGTMGNRDNKARHRKEREGKGRKEATEGRNK